MSASRSAAFSLGNGVTGAICPVDHNPGGSVGVSVANAGMCGL